MRNGLMNENISIDEKPAVKKIHPHVPSEPGLALSTPNAATNTVRGFSPPKPTETMTTFTNKVFFALAALTLVASTATLSSYAQAGNSVTHAAHGSQIAIHIAKDILLGVTFETGRETVELQPGTLMFMCDAGQVRSTRRTMDNVEIELEQCQTPRGLDPLPENWIDSDVSTYEPATAAGMPAVDLTGQWLNLPPVGLEDEQAQGYSFARVRITITARPRSR